MDPDGLAALKKETRAMAARGATVLYTTQILEVAESFSDRVIVLAKGTVHAFDRVEALRGSAGADGESVLASIFAGLRQTGRDT